MLVIQTVFLCYSLSSLSNIFRLTPLSGVLGQSYKTFYVRKIRMFVICQSVYHQQAFPAQPNVCEKGWSLPNWSTLKKFPFRVGSWPYHQTLNQAGKAHHQQTLQLFTNIRKFRTLGPVSFAYKYQTRIEITVTNKHYLTKVRTLLRL